MFFGNVYSICHDIYEDFLTHVGITWKQYFQSPEFLVPIRHTECNYLKPLPVGESFEAHVSLSKIGDSSFEVRFRLQQDSNLHAEVKIACVFVASHTRAKTTIPNWFRTKMTPYLETSP